MTHSRPDQTAVLPSSGTLDVFETLKNLMTLRRDVRRFRTDPIKDDILADIMQLISLSPSVGNSQPWKWVQVKTPLLREKIQSNFEKTNAKAQESVSDDKKALYNSLKLAGLKEAPVQFAVYCDHSTQQGAGLGRQSMPETLNYSVVCAIMNVWLGAKAKGLGLGWVSILEPKAVSDILDVPDTWTLIAYLCLGYPVEDHTDPELERYDWQKRIWSPDNIMIK